MNQFLLNIFQFLLFAASVYIVVRLIRLFTRLYLNRARSLNMVFLKIMIPKKESKEDREQEQATYSSGKDFKEILGEASHLYEALYSIYNSRISAYFIGQDYFSVEYAVIENQIYFYAVVPREFKTLFEKQITSFYPDSYVEQVEDYNLFKENSKVAASTMYLNKHYMFPIQSYLHLKSDPLNNITNVLSKLGYDDGAAIQLMLRPAKDGWQKKGRAEAKAIFTQSKPKISALNPLSWFSAIFDALVRGDVYQGPMHGDTSRTTPLTDEEVKAMEEKNSKIGYEAIIRIVTSAPTLREAKSHLMNIQSAFAQYSSPNANCFVFPKIAPPEKNIIKEFVLRSFKRPLRMVIQFKKDILS